MLDHDTAPSEGPRREVAVVIPTHDRPDLLDQALASVSGQTLLPVEVVVVSDTDDPTVRRLCDERTSGDLSVRYVHNRTQPGASGSRNAGAAATDAPVLAFLDDDDLWSAEYLATASMTLGMAGPGCDAVITWLTMFRGDPAQSVTFPGPTMTPGLTAEDVGGDNPGMTGSNVVIRRSAFEKLGGFDPGLPVKNDGDFLYRFLMEGLDYAVVERFLVQQRKHDHGQLTGRTMARADGLERYLVKHRATLSRRNRRRVRLSATRIRYHAATRPGQRVRYLLTGAWYSSPSGLFQSWRNRTGRRFWLTR